MRARVRSSTIFRRLYAQQLHQIFGKSPDVLVVSSDLWDVASWWRYSGRPAIFPVPHSHVSSWCHSTLPQFLDFVQMLVPTAPLAYRSPQPCWNDAAGKFQYLQSIGDSMEEMAACVRKSRYNATHLFAAAGPKYRFLDWNMWIHDYERTGGGDIKREYRNNYHLGPSVTKVTMTKTLGWVRQI
mmetsp:Transcript_46364/g.87017  ORF Transcript_46364/g.87017 Transcript_46364/m.87017 type:complete len:184 (-) Transcript_46364:19-570(-)